MQLFTATLVKNKCTFLTILQQQKLALVMSFQQFSDRWEFETEKVQGARDEMVCWAGQKCTGAGKISQTHTGEGQGVFKFCGCGAMGDTKFQLVQDFHSKPSPFYGVKRFQQAKSFPDFIHLLSSVGIFRR